MEWEDIIVTLKKNNLTYFSFWIHLEFQSSFSEFLWVCLPVALALYKKLSFKEEQDKSSFSWMGKLAIIVIVNWKVYTNQDCWIYRKWLGIRKKMMLSKRSLKWLMEIPKGAGGMNVRERFAQEKYILEFLKTWEYDPVGDW